MGLRLPSHFFLSHKSISIISFFLLFFGGISPARAQPVITSFSPQTVCQGGTVTISGTNFDGATTVRLGGVDAAGFTVNNSTTITATVADQAVSGPIIVTTPGGSVTGSPNLTILPSPRPILTDVSTHDAPFSNCDGSSSYQLIVRNNSVTTGTGNIYQINWGDNTPIFTQTDWAAGAQTSHTYSTQGYFPIVITIIPPNGCTKSSTYQFYNGKNPLASFTTTNPTTGLCIPAPVEFQIGNWINNSPGTTYQVSFGDGSPNVTLQHPLNPANIAQVLTHNYTISSCPAVDFTATLKAINGCFTTTYTLNQIIIRRKPAADFTIPSATQCVNTPVCFTNQTANGYSGNSCSTTSSFLWDFGDGTTSTAINPPCHAYASPGNYTVTLTASNTACGSDTRTKQITILPVSPPPVVSASPIIYCRGEVASQLTATGTGLLWYTTATGGTGNPVAPVPSTATPGTTTYYVSQTITNSCESPRVPVIVTVNPLPNAPTIAPVQLCQGQPAGPLTAAGTNLLWYSSQTGGTGSSTAPVPSTSSVGSTTYYVSQTVSGCEGPRASIVVTVNPLPVTPTVTSPVTYCQNQSAIPLTASGPGLLWYTSATGGTGSSIAPTPSTATIGTTTYHVSQGNICGESARVPLTVIVNPGPSASISYTPSNLCNVVHSSSTPNPPIAVTQTGVAGGTYSISPATGLALNATSGEVNPSGATAGVYTIRYVIAGTGGCSNFETTTSVIVTGTPLASISYPPICTSHPITNVSVNGTQGGTFTSTAGLTLNVSTGSITPASSVPGTYTVTYTIAPAAPCPGFVTTTNVTVTQAPSASISYTPSNLCNAAHSSSTPNPPIAVTQTGVAGGIYSISPATGLTLNTTTGEINPSGATPGLYTIKYTVSGTGGCSNFETTATVIVTGTPTASISYPAICTSDPIRNVSVSGTQGGTFTSTTGLVINASTGSITPASSVPGTYTVTYTIAPAAPCPGFVTTTNVTVTQAPSASISYSPSTLCNTINSSSTPNLPVAVTQTGTTGGTYSISPLTGMQINSTTGEINPSGATPGAYTITYTVIGIGGCANFSTTAAVTIISSPTAVINYPQSAYCGGISVPQQVSFSGTTGGTYSSTQGLSLNTSSGAINPSLSIPGIYTVTYTIVPSPPCPGFVTTTNVQINESPVVSFPTSTQSICSGGTADFIPSSTVNNTVYNWSVVGPLPANITGVNSGTASGTNPSISLSFINTGTVSQLLNVRVIPTNPTQQPCDGVAYNLQLNVNPVPPAPIVDTVHLCMGSPPVALQVSPLPGNIIRWYDISSTLLGGAPVISTAAPGMFTYYVSQTNTYGCESPKSEIIAIVDPTLKIIASAFTNPVTCGMPTGSIVLDVVDLNDNPVPVIPVIVHYEKFQIAYSYATYTDPSGKITIPLTAGTYSGIYVETGVGCNSQMIPDVFILRDPTPPAQPSAGYNPPICSENMLTLTALSAASSQTGPISYVWAGPAFGPLADTIRNSVVSFPSALMSYAGTYVVYAIQNNCISLPVSFQVVISQSPSRPVINTRTPLCVGDDLVLQAFSSFPGNGPLTYQWNGPGAAFPVNSSSVRINNVRLENSGVYSITVTSPQTGCSSTTDTLIQVGGYPIVKFAQDTLTLPTGYLLNLSPVITNAAAPGILPIKNYNWTPFQDLNCNDAICSSPVATIKNNICYAVKVTNVYGCSGSDEICIKVFCQNSQVFVPNAFVPRGDVPENTRLTVRASGIASVKSFIIFNRWGRVVFQKSNFPPNSYDFGWDGKINGKLADTGVYVYIVEVTCENGATYSYKGNVTLF